MPTISVMIATYRRPDDLAACLAALSRQSAPPHDVNVVCRAEDGATQALLDGLAGTLPFRLRRQVVSRPGVVAARNLGLDTTETEIVAIIDDDTEPHPDWLARMGAHFAADPRLGGLGGRDAYFAGGQPVPGRPAAVVGRLQWFGRIVGNHHLGHGAPREVDLLKGANMAFRMAAVGAIRFDEALRGDGAQPCEDVAFSLAVKRAGWRIVYDPEVAVRHNQGPRAEARHYATRGAVRGRERHNYTCLCYNEVLAIWPSLSPAGRVAYVLFGALCGTGVTPGLLQIARSLRALGLSAVDRFLLCQRGKAMAFAKLFSDARAGTA